MARRVFIAEKPSVARDFARALGETFRSGDGYMESEQSYVTWCYGHLVTMCYPDVYDPKLKRWSLDTIPFIPGTYRYQVIDEAHTKRQFAVVKKLLTAKDVDTIYICTDSGREGEYIYRLVAQEAGVKGKRQLRVWIDSFTDAEIRRGIREAKDDSAYDNMGAAAYLRAQEDYLMGINFSRALSLKYAGAIRDFLGIDHCVIAVGRVMTCVLGMVVSREREIRSFVKTPFYRVIGTFSKDMSGNGQNASQDGKDSAAQAERETPSSGESGCAGSDLPDASSIEAEWMAREGSRFFASPVLYKENGFRKREDAQGLIDLLTDPDSGAGDCVPRVLEISHKKEQKKAPLLYNLAELQNDCSRILKLSPDETLKTAQTLYERGLTTYPRTDARVLSTAVAKEIDHNLKGIGRLPEYRELARTVAESGSWKSIAKTKYTNDKVITDHYAIIPTGEGLGKLSSLKETERRVYDFIVRRFLAIFYPAAVFDKISLLIGLRGETFQTSVKIQKEEGYLVCLSGKHRGQEVNPAEGEKSGVGFEDDVLKTKDDGRTSSKKRSSEALEAFLGSLKKGDLLQLEGLAIREGETTPPKRYTGGSMILAMENAGQLIEDEELREQIRGSGIGTSATRSGILEKLTGNQYLSLNAKTQIYTPTQLGEMIYDVVDVSLRPLLDPRLTASWEKGLTQVAGGMTTQEEYRDKLNDYVARRTNAVKESNYGDLLQQMYRRDAQFYPKPMKFGKKYSYGKGRIKQGTAKGTKRSSSAGGRSPKKTVTGKEESSRRGEEQPV